MRKSIKKIACMILVFSMLCSWFVVSPTSASDSGTTYYIDSTGGDDNNDGMSADSPWKSLDKVNETTFSPGDKILFKSDGEWEGRLWPKGSGEEGNPIVIDKYGSDDPEEKPLISGVTSELEAVYLKNQEYWEINNLEVTNRSSIPFDRNWQNERGQRRGVYILNEEAGILHHIHIKNMNIHDVDGSYTTRSGGIIFDSVGSTTPSAFDDILIDGNALTDVDAYGIYIGSNCILRYGMGDLWPWVQKPYGPWTPSTNVRVSNNSVVRAATGGIAWNVTDGAVVEHNTVQEATYLATNASIWWAYADNNLVQFNESFGSVHGEEDGHGFDVDAGNIGSLVQYNYSHDNAGGFMLYVNDTYWTLNTIVRYNISQNDKGSIFRYSGSIDNVYNYNNTVYVGQSSGNPVMSDYYVKASGEPRNIKNYNNAYYSAGDKGWNLTGQIFDYNAYYGGKTTVESDAHKVTAEPGFIAPGTGGNGMDTVGGYKLHEDSPLIGAGIRISDAGSRDYFGNKLYNQAPDIGAYEYEGKVPAAGEDMPDPIEVVKAGTIDTPNDDLAPQATASTTFTTSSSQPAANMNDKHYNTAWSSEVSPSYPNYITLDFGGKAVSANQLKLNTRSGKTYGIAQFDLEYDNGSGWVPIKTDIHLNWDSDNGQDEIKSVEFPLTRFSKMRLKVNEGAVQPGAIAVNEIELYNNPELNKGMVTTSFPTGDNPITNIIDGNINSAWGTPGNLDKNRDFPGDITIDYGNNPITLNKLTLYTHFGKDQGITNFDVEYYDGSEWKTALSDAKIEWQLSDSTREPQSVTFPTITAHKLRLKVKAANLTWDCIALTELVAEYIPDKVPVTGIQLDKPEVIFNPSSSSIALQAIVIPDNATNKKVTWGTDNAQVAKVDDNGRVTAVGEGKAVITATSEEGGFQADSNAMVDWTAPEIRIGSVVSSEYNTGLLQPAKFTVTDQLSGVDHTKTAVMLDDKILTDLDDIALNTLELGQHKITVKACDLAGNCAAKSVDFKVKSTSGGSTTVPATPVPTPTPTPAPTLVPKPTPTPPVTNDGNIARITIEVQASVDKATGTASAKIEAGTIASLIDNVKKAEASAQKLVIEIKVKRAEDAKAVELQIPSDDFKKIAETAKAEVKIDTGMGTITFDKKAVVSISSQVKAENISISAKKVDPASLTETVRAKLGDRPVYNFTLQAGSTPVSSFGEGSAQISIPYTPKSGEKHNSIVVYRMDREGVLTTAIGKFDPLTEKVNFAASRFSYFAVGYNEVNFSDVAETDWYNEAVGFMAARNMISGVGGDRFAPMNRVTRADFLIMLMNTYDIGLDSSIQNNFDDAGSKYYAGYLGTAKRLGLVSGVGNNKFKPEAAISREDMFVILFQALRTLDRLPTDMKGTSLDNFKDAGETADYAKDAMKQFVETGIIAGDGTNLSPKEISTRGETAQILYRLL
ncbi:S-layer homology domain-containing protein [Paenibacillus sp. J23TS9]|uniref:S-layer homology domain-containing protein n=1 Tax=Paenibacillus sp. J23TS9 TaxID=2807193 RepID=UPI001FD28E26|nr:S-layer homology domain-containing protein [Paenibacillus sp. J23TS9]